MPLSVFITGASRGVGASIALQLAARGASVALNFRSKAPRAQAVAAQIKALGSRAILAGADITDENEMRVALESTHQEFGALDLLILNASGGLEKNQASDYALVLNRDAQIQTLDLALPLLKDGARVVFVTSHLAHFWGEKPVPAAYEPVAQSKKAGELALLARIPELEKRSISLVIVSGDAIEGTITLKILARKSRGETVGDAREPGRVLPTVEEFAGAIVNAALDSNLQSGTVVFVGDVA